MQQSHSPIDAYIGKKIQRRRESMLMSREELSEMLGVSFAQMQKFERGIERIGALRLHRIASSLKVEPSYFFEGMAQEKEISIPGISNGNDSYLLSMMESYNRITDSNLKKNLHVLLKSMAGEQNKLFGKLKAETTESVH